MKTSNVDPIRPGEVHVWWRDLSEFPGESEELALLDHGERERARRYRFEQDRLRFIAAHGSLRRLAGAYLGERPESLRFEPAADGKPRLRGAGLRFNLSKTRDAVLIGFAADREIGVDVERIRADYCGADIAEQFFSPAEVEALSALPEEDRPAAFFRCWTGKEAYVKARGDGLGYPLDRFAVDFAAGAEPRRFAWHADPEEAKRWWLMPWRPADGYAAAIAVPGEDVGTILGKMDCA